MKDSEVFFAFKIASMVYEEFLRDLVVEKLEDPDSKIDDFVMGLLDTLFGYKK
jgi:hypothetical protein